MCGRYRLSGDIDVVGYASAATGLPVAELAAPVRLALTGDRIFRPYNDIPVLAAGSRGGLVMALMYWQLIHYWCERFESKYTSFNTRRESLGRKHNMELLARRRCLVPATSFFETRKLADGSLYRPREAYEFSLREGGAMMLGGIYSVWRNPQDSSDRRPSCSIITTEPNSIVGEIHPRMPFIVPPRDAALWLDRNVTGHQTLLGMIQPLDARALVRVKEEKRVSLE